MEDDSIIELFFQRSEEAIPCLAEKYEKLLCHVSSNILNNAEDVKECVNDTYLGVWNTIPPQRPNPFTAFLCKIIRNISLKKYRNLTAKKRNRNLELSIEEFAECIPSSSVEEIWSARELGNLINAFLGKLKEQERTLFMRRYWFSDSIQEIAELTGLKENNVSVKLLRIRKDLKRYLQKEGFRV